MKTVTEEKSFRKTGNGSFSFDYTKKKYGYVIRIYKNEYITNKDKIEHNKKEVLSFYTFSLRKDFFERAIKKAMSQLYSEDLWFITDTPEEFINEIHTEIFCSISQKYRIDKRIPLFRLKTGKHKELWTKENGEWKIVKEISIEQQGDIYKIKVNGRVYLAYQDEFKSFKRKFDRIINGIKNKIDIK